MESPSSTPFTRHLQEKFRRGINGRIHGNICFQHELSSQKDGMVHAQVQTGAALIRRTVQGDIHSQTKITIPREARVVGHLSNPRGIPRKGTHLRGDFHKSNHRQRQRNRNRNSSTQLASQTISNSARPQSIRVTKGLKPPPQTVLNLPSIFSTFETLIYDVE